MRKNGIGMPEDVFTPETEDRSFARDKMVRDWLRKPFPPDQIGKIPASKGRPALDYVGHAAVTDRLNKIAPDWTYTVDNMSAAGDTVWIRGTMVIGGVSRVEFGDGKDPKEAVGNFIRRGAMRFGVAIDLWSREELDTSDAAHVAGTQASDRSGEDQHGPAEKSVSSPEHHFPVDPVNCDHKTAAGRWVKWVWTESPQDGVNHEVCPKCGTPKLVAMEGTTADLGPA